MMKRKTIMYVLAAVLVLGWLAFHFSRPKEPSYQGRSLTQWLKEYDFNSRIRAGIYTESKMKEPEQAVRAIGTNGIPTLLRLLTAKDPPGMWELQTFLHRIGIWVRLCNTTEKVQFACNGFMILGRQAQPAVPALVHIAITETWYSAERGRPLAYACLLMVEPDKKIIVPLLLKEFNQSNQTVARHAGYILAIDYEQDAEQAGVYKKFPQYNQWRRGHSTNAPSSENLPSLPIQGQ
jgi:hypothetical protein